MIEEKKRRSVICIMGNIARILAYTFDLELGRVEDNIPNLESPAFLERAFLLEGSDRTMNICSAIRVQLEQVEQVFHTQRVELVPLVGHQFAGIVLADKATLPHIRPADAG